MEPNIRTMEPEVLIPQLLQLLQNTDAVPLVITGSSMTPFLVHGRDTVYLSKPGKLHKGDMVLYRRRSGQYVLHRICKVPENQYWLLGDAQTVIEKDIRPQQILATVTALRRKGRLIKPGDFLWEFFRGPWLWLRPLRPLLWKLYTFFKR